MTTAVPDHAADPHGRVRWLGVVAAIASISVVGIAIGLGVPLLSVILDGRGYSPTLIGLNTAVAGIASIAAAPLATPLAIRFGVVPTIVTMIVVGAFSFAGFYFADSFWMWFPLRAALHVAITVLFILSEFWITASAPPWRRSGLSRHAARTGTAAAMTSAKATPNGRKPSLPICENSHGPNAKPSDSTVA